jgi:peptide/nickel transport system substrate-binding protein
VRGKALLLNVFLLAVLLVGCGAPTAGVVEKEVTRIVEETVVVEGTPQVVEKAVTAEPERWTGSGFGGVLHVAMGGSPPTLDSPTTTEVSTQLVSLQINETLVAMSENYKVVPMLAKSWEVSDDGKTYTFALREGIKFHNGEEMTAEDVVASYERFIAVSARASSFSTVASAQAKDKYTVVFTLTEPDRGFLRNLAYVTAELAIQPKSVIVGKGAGELKVPEEIIGTGPYRLAEYSADTLIVLKRFEDYQPLPGARDGMAGGKIPYVDEIQIHIVPDPAALMLGVESGDYQIPADVGATQIQSIEGKPHIEISTFYPGYSDMILFNHAVDFTSDVNFRQAILAALDMQEVGLYASGGDSTKFRLNPYLWPREGAMYLPNDSLAESLYNQNNVEKAKELLAKSGYQGEELVWVSTRDWEVHYLIAVAVADQLEKKLGLNIKIDVYDAASMEGKMEEPTGWNFSVGQYGSYNFFPMVLYSFYNCNSTSSLRAGYCNSAFDAAYQAAVRSTNDAEEEAAYREVQRIWYEDLPAIKMYEEPTFNVFRDNVKGFQGWYRMRFFGVWLDQG